MSPEVATLLEQYIDRRERDGTRLGVDTLCQELSDAAGVAQQLAELIRSYEALESSLEFRPANSVPASSAPASSTPASNVSENTGLPVFDGFRTIERLSSGGMGEVYKLEDLRLGRTVAAKVLRPNAALHRAYGDFLREARSLALFQDPGIVQIHEYREGEGSPVILMEYVEGFELGRIARSLEVNRRAHLLAEICDVVQRAHEKGIQHRDLKPGNILVDADLRPKIVDFGLSDSNPHLGHGIGTPGYVAPEQLDPNQPIDERADVYALGVILYEMLCGRLPFEEDLTRPPLPMEIDPSAPEPLQAIALKAMEVDPKRRYASARDLALDLRRYLDGRPVMARPSAYATALDERIRPHLDELREWLRVKLIYPHEATRLFQDYHRLEAREDDWIVESRRLTLSQISLYLGAFVLLIGGFFFLAAHSLFEVIEGINGPLVYLGLPCLALNLAARYLEGRERKAVAVAYYLAGTAILPIFLVLFFHELGLWPATDEAFAGSVSNRDLQISTGLASLWALALALRTRTLGLSTGFVVLLVAWTLALQTDFGLESWLEDGRWDLLALHTAPLLALITALAVFMERSKRAWLATPLYLGGAALFVVVLELLALDGRAFAYLGWNLDAFESAGTEDPVLLETLAAMTLSGLLIYAVASFEERWGSEISRQASRLLFVVSPFAVLAPLSWLSSTQEYAPFFHWIHLILAITITLLSRHRQRKSFFLAGIFGTGLALYFLADIHDWFEVPRWSISLIGAGLLALIAGVGLDHIERTRKGAHKIRPYGSGPPATGA